MTQRKGGEMRMKTTSGMGRGHGTLPIPIAKQMLLIFLHRLIPDAIAALAHGLGRVHGDIGPANQRVNRGFQKRAVAA